MNKCVGMATVTTHPGGYHTRSDIKRRACGYVDTFRKCSGFKGAKGPRPPIGGSSWFQLRAQPAHLGGHRDPVLAAVLEVGCRGLSLGVGSSSVHVAASDGEGQTSGALVWRVR